MSWIRNSRDCVARSSVAQSHQLNKQSAASGTRLAPDFTSYPESVNSYVGGWVALSKRLGIWQHYTDPETGNRSGAGYERPKSAINPRAQQPFPSRNSSRSRSRTGVLIACFTA